MNVLLLLKGVLLGGAENDVLRLAQGLGERGHRVIVGAEGEALLEAVNDAGLSCERLPPAGIGNAFLGAARFVARICREHQIDVINAHSIWMTAHAALAGRFVGRRVPLVATVHNIHDRRNDLLAYPVLRYLADEVVFVSRYEQERLEKRWGRRLGQVLPSGIPVPELESVEPVDLTARHGIARDALVIGFVGRLSAQKGVADAIAALEDLPKPTVLCVVGSGPEEAALRAEVARRKLGARVVFVGWQQNVNAYLRSFFLLVLPSRREALPVVLRQAGALALPVVAADVGGVSEIVAHERTGLLYPAGDIDALARTLQTLLDAPERARELGRRARRFVAKRFDLERWLRETETILESVCR